MKLSLIALALAGFAQSALAATPIEQSRPLAADGQVAIENLKGSITVRTWDRPEVRIGGSLGAGVEKLDISGDPRNLHIKVRYPQHDGGWFGGKGSEPSDLQITVPTAANLEIESVSARIDLEGGRGRRLAIESVSGAVRVANTAVEQASVETVSGGQQLKLDSRSLELSSVSGRIRAEGNIQGAVSVETVSGGAAIGTGAVSRMELSTVSGSLEVATRLQEAAKLSAEAVSGGITLNLPRDSSARLQAETFSGGIHSAIGEVERQEFGPGSSLDVEMGAASAQVELESFSGSVNIELR